MIQTPEAFDVCKNSDGALNDFSYILGVCYKLYIFPQIRLLYLLSAKENPFPTEHKTFAGDGATPQGFSVHEF